MENSPIRPQLYLRFDQRLALGGQRALLRRAEKAYLSVLSSPSVQQGILDTIGLTQSDVMTDSMITRSAPLCRALEFQATSTSTVVHAPPYFL